jgi:adenylate kinase family enzyme
MKDAPVRIRRIKEYEERTIPMVEYLEKDNHEIHKINGEQSVADVFKDIAQNQISLF